MVNKFERMGTCRHDSAVNHHDCHRKMVVFAWYERQEPTSEEQNLHQRLSRDVDATYHPVCLYRPPERDPS